MRKNENDPKSLLMLLASMLIFGSIGIFRRSLPLSSSFLACSRGLLGGFFILAFAKLKKGSAGKLPRRVLLQLMLSGAMIGFNWMLLFEAYNHTTVAVATLCYYMQPTIVVLLSPLIFREKLTAKQAVCAAVAILGMVLVSGVFDGADARRGNLRGVLFGLGAAVLYSAVVILNKRITGVGALQKTPVQLLSAGAVMIPYLLLTEGFSFGALQADSVPLLLVMGLVHTGLAYVLYFGSMDGLKAQSVAIFSYADPVFALLLSALVLREPLTLPALLGAVMIIGSALLSEK